MVGAMILFACSVQYLPFTSIQSEEGETLQHCTDGRSLASPHEDGRGESFQHCPFDLTLSILMHVTGAKLDPHRHDTVKLLHQGVNTAFAGSSTGVEVGSDTKIVLA